MDALKRPLSIPPDFSKYAEEKGLFELYEKMLIELLVDKPKDPFTFFLNYLSQWKDNVITIVVYGPPSSGQNTISKLIGQKLRAVHLKLEDVLQDYSNPATEKVLSLRKVGKEISEDIWAEVLKNRTKEKDCCTKGWILEGFPRTRKQALALQTVGVMPTHFVHLEAPDAVLIERYAGKRVDSLTGDVYHLIFAPPKTKEVEGRLVEEAGGLEVNMSAPLTLYHRDSTPLLSCYSNILKQFNCDQPIHDLFAQVIHFLCTVPSTVAPRTPHVLLLGPTGSGKSLQASQLARKYRLEEVDCRLLLKQTLASGSKIGLSMKPFHERGMLIPDGMVMSVLSKRLGELDCVTRGFVLHGFPLNRDQAEILDKSNHQPNRVFFLNIPEDSIKERLTLRRIDPETGEKYHLLFKPPPNQEVKDRLLKHPKFSEDEVIKRIESYNLSVDDLVDYYSWGQHINADQDPLTVFECVESALVNPLPNPPPPGVDLDD